MEAVNLEYRKIIDVLGIEIYNFYESIERNEWYTTKEIYSKFLDMYPEKKNYTTQTRLTRAFSIYCDYKKMKQYKSTMAGITKIMLSELEKKQEIIDDELPF